MRALLIGLLLFSSLALGGSMIARDSRGNIVWLYEEPCTLKEALDKIEPTVRERFRRAEMLYEGKPYRACWALENNAVHILDEVGEYLRLPPGVFRYDAGV